MGRRDRRIRENREAKSQSKPPRYYPWPAYLSISAFSLMWIGCTLKDGQYYLGDPDPVLITRANDPIWFWTPIVICSIALLAIVPLLVKGEVEHRKSLVDSDQRNHNKTSSS